MVDRMLAQGRYALLLRSQIAPALTEDQWSRACRALESSMALVPEGEVVLGRIEEDSEAKETCRGRARGAAGWSSSEASRPAVCRGRAVRVAPLFLDRWPVTNRQFQAFVEGGGYEQIGLWETSIWPAVLDFVDATGRPGPRFWRDGCSAPGKEDHPVVGVSWYEAAAYARWVGKRLPSDAEWVKAGSWPVTLSPEVRMQRRYPWGETADRGRANLWGSGPAQTVPVDQFAGGVSVGGVYQLIGNVWEWTAGDFQGQDCSGEPLVLTVPMKTLRGGAFDTYFDQQATCQFASGDCPLARKHNIGFRCAIGACDLVLEKEVAP